MAPNVALTPLQKGGQASPSAPSSSHPHGAESEGARSGRKRRLTGETHPSPQPCPSATASKPLPPSQEERDSDVEVEVESREECEYSVAPYHCCSTSLKECSRFKASQALLTAYGGIISQKILISTIVFNIDNNKTPKSEFHSCISTIILFLYK